MEAREKLTKAVREYREGKEEAFIVLYEESKKYLYTCIYNVVSGKGDVRDMTDDIMQDTYVEISKSISQLKSVELFLPWAGRIATNKSRAYLNKKGKYTLFLDEEEE